MTTVFATRVAAVACTGLLAACGRPAGGPASGGDYFGTLEPFASESVYFVMTDRYVDGDPSNNHPEQGGAEWHTFDRPIVNPSGGEGNIGYLGGDFRGLLDNAGYIAEMGFTSVWITPIVDNPDEAFSGGETIETSAFPDHGKTGFHGYWGVNFFEVDEHLESDGLRFADLTRRMRDEYGLGVVLDIVANHGSPSFTMPTDQPKFGEIYGRRGELLADHQNLPPEELDPENPLHRFFHTEPDINQLSNMNDRNPEVLEYFVAAYSKWIDQGAGALRIDTIKHMPHEFWRQFAGRIRESYPGLFMFAESWQYDAARIAEHTWPENGGISVLDFPMKQAMDEVFAGRAGYERVLEDMHLDDGLYANPYELMTFYDNHDMPRMAADDNGFVNAHNFLFTSRGIPVVYYGSEMAFRAGRAEHSGNRDYFGQENVNRARTHRIRTELARIASVRRESPALQRGVQANLVFDGDLAVFFRVFQQARTAQTALVALNKGDETLEVAVDRWLSAGSWRDAMSGQQIDVTEGSRRLELVIPPNGARILLFDGPVNDSDFAVELARLSAGARARSAR